MALRAADRAAAVVALPHTLFYLGGNHPFAFVAFVRPAERGRKHEFEYPALVFHVPLGIYQTEYSLVVPYAGFEPFIHLNLHRLPPNAVFKLVCLAVKQSVIAQAPALVRAF